MNKILIVTLIALITIGQPLLSYGQGGAEQLEDVNFRLNWKPGAEHVAYYVALEKGFYEEVGLNVNIVVGSGSADSVKLTAIGQFDFALAAGGNVIQARAKDMPLKVVAVIYQDDPTSFTVLKDSGIEKLEDLIGKKIGVQYDSSTFPEYLALMERNKIDRAEVEEVSVSFGIEPLLLGQVDAFPGFLTQRPVSVEISGNVPNVIPFKDYGVNIYGVSIITTEPIIKANSDLVSRFVHASLKGWEYTFDHKSEAIDILLSKFPEVDKNYAEKELNLLIPLISTDMTERMGLGYSSQERWNDSVDILHEQKVISEKIDAASIFTNDFIIKP